MVNFKSLIRVFFTFGLILQLCSCASSKRMIKLSPFKADGQTTLGGEYVNLWPAFYSNGDFTSFFWPLGDYDKNGLAVRPFYNQHKDEYSVLFPFAAWNPVKKNGWVTTAYWFEDSYGCFPFFHKSKKLNYYFPFYYDAEKFAYYGVLPFYFHDKDLNIIAPAWWDDDSCGVFPFYWQNGLTSGTFFPFYDYNKTEKDFELDLFLQLGGRLQYNDKLSHGRLLNFYYKNNQAKDDNSLSAGVFPLAMYYEDKNKERFFSPLYFYKKNADQQYHISPLFYSNVKKDEAENFSLLHYYKKTPEKRSLVTMFGGGTLDNNDKLRMLSILGPAYVSWDYPNDKFTSVMWPFYFKSVQKDYTKTGLLPFYYNYDSEKEKFSSYTLYMKSSDEQTVSTALLPFYYYCKNKDDDGKRLMALLGLYGYSENEYEKEHSILWPLNNLKFRKDKDRGTCSFSSLRMWPFFSYNDYCLPLIYYSNNKFWLLGPLGIYYSQIDDSRNINFLLFGEYKKSFTEQKFADSEFKYSYSKNYKEADFKQQDIVRHVESSSLVMPLLFTYNECDNLILSDSTDQLFCQRALSWLDRLDYLLKYEQGLNKSKKPDKKALAKYKKDFDFAKYRLKKNMKRVSYQNFTFKNRRDIDKIYGFIENNFTEKAGSVDFSSLPFSYFNDHQKTEWDVFWLLARGKVEKDIDTDFLAVLEYFYRYERSGRKERITLFPFISYEVSDTVNKFSLMWHLFNIERKDNSYSGHFFFIPF